MKCVKTLPELRAMSAHDWGCLSKDDQDAIKKSKPYRDLQAEFKASIDSNPTAVVALTKAFNSLRLNALTVLKNDLVTSEVSEDSEAMDALFGHLSAAFYDPKIIRSKAVFQALSDLISSIGDMSGNAISRTDLTSAFAQPARSAVNSTNAQKVRSAYNTDAKDLYEKWLAAPELYKNKAAFKRDVLEKGWCKDIGTAGRWLASFISDSPPSDKWRLRIEKKK